MLSLMDEKRMADSYFQRSSAVDAFMLFCPTVIEESFLETAKKRHIPVIGINLEVPEQDMVKNTEACADLAFQLIKDKAVTNPAPEGSFSFFEMNI